MGKMTRKQFLQTLFTGTLALVASNNTGCSNAKQSAKKENPYAYSLDAFKHIDPKHITHKEGTPISLNTAPRCITLTPEKQILVGVEKGFRLFPANGGSPRSFSLPEPPYALAATDKHSVFIAFRTQIAQYNLQKKQLQVLSDLGEKAFITGLDVNAKHIIVADYGNKQLWLFNRKGTLLRFIGIKSGQRHPDGLKIPSPYFDTHFAGDGSVWATNPGMHRLEHYNLTGKRLAHWGKPGMTLEGFSGCCNPTHFTLLSLNRFATVEKGLVRIKIYSNQGKLLSVVAPPDAFQEGLTGISLAADRQGNIFVADKIKKQIRVFSKK